MAAARKGFLGFVGFWAFIIGFILAILAGIFWPTNEAIIIVLVVLGIIIGLLNIAAKEFMLFLLATIALVVVGGQAFSALGTAGAKLGDVLSHIAILVSPAAIIAAVKALWAVGKPGE
ncbi:MAG: hypothetical protein ACUVTR_05130 [Dehalococcoidia bacterium]